jgi:5-methylcytosine-specific restriction endonuclease McrA
MCPKPKSLRKHLYQKEAAPCCFYCGLPFDINPLDKKDSLYRSFSKHARMTLEHLIPVVNGGETNGANCVLSHKWCNETAKDLPIQDKLELRETLLQYVETYNWVPWKYKYKFRAIPNRLSDDRIIIKGKAKLKENIFAENDKCYYCGLPFGIVPVSPGTVVFKKLKSYARMLVVPLIPFNADTIPDASNCVLAHHWCRNKAMHLSGTDKRILKTTLTTQCLETGILPWIDDDILNKHLMKGGTLVEDLGAK